MVSLQCCVFWLCDAELERQLIKGRSWALISNEKKVRLHFTLRSYADRSLNMLCSVCFAKKESRAIVTRHA
jgi:hypothetical protein